MFLKKNPILIKMGESNTKALSQFTVDRNSNGVEEGQADV